jgi:hypothetical protein
VGIYIIRNFRGELAKQYLEKVNDSGSCLPSAIIWAPDMTYLAVRE